MTDPSQPAPADPASPLDPVPPDPGDIVVAPDAAGLDHAPARAGDVPSGEPPASALPSLEPVVPGERLGPPLGATRRIADYGRPHPSYVYNDVFAEQLHARLQQNPFARRMLLEPALDHLPDRALKRLSEAFGMPPKQITRGSVAAVSNAELARIIGSSTEAAAKLRLTALGLPAPRPPQPPVKGPVSKPRLRR